MLGDIVGRFAGDEFVVLVIGHLDNGALEHFVDRFDRVRSGPIGIPGDSLQVGVSIASSVRTRTIPAICKPRPRDARASNFSKFTRAQS